MGCIPVLFSMQRKVFKELLSDTIKNSIDLEELDKDDNNVIYHCTTFKKANKLLSSNMFKCRTSHLDSIPHICCTHKANYMVFADSKIQLVLDKSKLEKDFESKPVDVYGGDYEGEVRYYTDSPLLNDFNKYISKIRLSSTSLNSLLLWDLLCLNCSFDKTIELVNSKLFLDDLEFDELSEVLKLERLCKQYNIPICDRLSELIKLNRLFFSSDYITKLINLMFSLYHEEHTLQGVVNHYYKVEWGNYEVFSGYYGSEFIDILNKIRLNYPHLVDSELTAYIDKLNQGVFA